MRGVFEQEITEEAEWFERKKRAMIEPQLSKAFNCLNLFSLLPLLPPVQIKGGLLAI